MNNNDDLSDVFDEDNIVISKDDIFKALDEIRAETMFKSREECLHIIREVVYAYGVNEGRVKARVFEAELRRYREKLDDVALERLAALCLKINAARQKEEEFNKALNENENGIETTLI